jgi:hypothetical protein
MAMVAIGEAGSTDCNLYFDWDNYPPGLAHTLKL